MKLKGVKMLRIEMEAKDRMSFIGEVYNTLGNFQTMIFLNKKDEAESMQTKLNK